MTGTTTRLAGFLKSVSGNRVFRQSHRSLYSALLVGQWRAGGANPFRISRRELMEHSAIRSFATYHKCITDLVEEGYIAYEPSYHPSLGSEVTLLDSFGNDEGSA